LAPFLFLEKPVSEELNAFQRTLLSHEDEVRGVIVGGDYVIGRLHYDGRPQGQQLVGRSDDEVIKKGKDLLDDIKRESGKAYPLIYLKALTAWETRIYD
jgi:hypothetical protein